MLSLTWGLPHPAHTSVIQIIRGAANVMNPLRHTHSHPIRFESATYAAVLLIYCTIGSMV